MAWNLNFCAPFLANDATINFNRYLQSIQLLILMIVYMILHFYYRMFGNRKQEQDQSQSSQESASENTSDENSSSNFNSKSDSDSNNDQSQDDDSRNEKIFSIGLGKDIQDGQSQDPFKQSTLGLKQDAKTKSIEDELQIVQNDSMTVQEVQKYFPIVYGHHAVIVGASIMYSPYTQQTLMAYFYFFLCLFLIPANIKRFRKITFGIWIIMCLINICIMMSGLLEVGQSNYDFIKSKCFSEQYVSLY